MKLGMTHGGGNRFRHQPTHGKNTEKGQAPALTPKALPPSAPLPTGPDYTTGISLNTLPEMSLGLNKPETGPLGAICHLHVRTEAAKEAVVGITGEGNR